MDESRSVFITGANGYIGFAVGRAFVRAGWRVYGLVRRPEAAVELARSEITPIVGTLENLDSLKQLYKYTRTIKVIVGATNVIPGYAAHFEKEIAVLQSLAKTSNENGVRPLVLWTSGCKDYGTTAVDGAPSLEAHTEQSPLAAWERLQERAQCSLKVFENTDVFDGVVLRPTNVYGYGSSHFAVWFETAQELQKESKKLQLTVNPKSILHSMHVDDCGEAYVALAEHRSRGEVGGQSFNVSSHTYETCEKIWAALGGEYGIEGQVTFVDPQAAKEQTPPSLGMIFGYSQWVSSEKIRRLTGWKDKRRLFADDIAVYRKAYEANAAEGDSEKVRSLLSHVSN